MTKAETMRLATAKRVWARTNKVVSELVDGRRTNEGRRTKGSPHDPVAQALRNEQGRKYQERVRKALKRFYRTGRIDIMFLRAVPLIVACAGLLGACDPGGYDPQYVESMRWEASTPWAEAHQYYVAREICDLRSRRHVYGYTNRYVIDWPGMTNCMAARGFVVSKN